MKKLLQALAIATLLQIGATSCLTAFLINRSSAESRAYSLMIEQRANEHTGTVVLNMYNQLQRERNADREDTHQYVDKQVALQIYKYFEGKK